MLSFLKRAPGSGSQVGVFVTPDGVAAAQVSPGTSGKPRLERCVFEPRDGQDPLARVASRLSARRAATVSVLDSSAYRLLLVEAPDVPPEELRAAVRWRIKDLIDFHVDEARSRSVTPGLRVLWVRSQTGRLLSTSLFPATDGCSFAQIAKTRLARAPLVERVGAGTFVNAMDGLPGGTLK
jgi:hypothetical protein